MKFAYTVLLLLLWYPTMRIAVAAFDDLLRGGVRFLAFVMAFSGIFLIPILIACVVIF